MQRANHLVIFVLTAIHVTYTLAQRLLSLASLVRIVQSMGAPPAQIVGLVRLAATARRQASPHCFVHAAITALQVHQNQNLVDLVLTATWQDSIRKASAHNATLGTTAQPMRCRHQLDYALQDFTA